MTRPRHLPEERASREERRRQVLAHRLLPALERELPDGKVLGRPYAGDRCADVDRAERRACCSEEPIDVGLDGQVGLGDRRAADLVRYGRRSLLAPVVVDEHVRSLGGEQACARGADSSRRAGDDHSLACETGVHEGVGYRDEGLHRQ